MRSPAARNKGLLTQVFPSNTIVYDLESHRVHTLTKVSAEIWRHADGKRSIAQIAHAVKAKIDEPIDEDVVKLGLERLAEADLLENYVPPNRISRRAMMKRVALLVAITTSIAPKFSRTVLAY